MIASILFNSGAGRATLRQILFNFEFFLIYYQLKYTIVRDKKNIQFSRLQN